MTRAAWRLGIGAAGLLVVLPGASLAAQTPYLRGTDAVSIGRSGAGVAYGRSLEAGALNPALLVTLQDERSAYLSLGMETQSSSSTLQSNSLKLFTTDRNRALPAMGAAWKLSPTFALGIKLDTPVLRHGTLPEEASSRFYWEGLDLGVHRLEVQGSWALSEKLSLGLGLGLARISYASDVSVRAIVPEDGSQAYNASTNPAVAMVEESLHQTATKTTGCYSLGLRYAINPRWTLGASYTKILKADLSLSASTNDRTPSVSGVYLNDPVPAGVDASVAAVVAGSHATAGSGSVEIPGVATLGVRHRFNQIFTWELDLRYTQGASFKLPSQPGLYTPSGQVSAPVAEGGYRNALGVSLMGEITFTKRLTGRIGMAMDGATVDAQAVDPVVGGLASSAFSLGMGYKTWGGELNVGVQARLSKDTDSSRLAMDWDLGGPRTISGKTRVEGTGYTWAVGFRRSF
ncbi:MAG: outer membrane protein transport protein (OMPP1/FadL/TodX) [Holophagaceae bacterium]|nr:outer membrane protein transport protein (OMPP1/FadL/TodX) [Holophagaceae bacterium]